MKAATVTSKAIAIGSYSGNVKTERVYYAISPHKKGSKSVREKVFHTTQYAAIQSEPIKLQSVEVKIKPYDTSKIDVRFIFFQVYKGDTVCHIKSVPPHLLKRKKMNLSLLDEEIKIQPDTFYMGYGVVPKHVEEEFYYRIFAICMDDRGALLLKQPTGIILCKSKTNCAVFPFVIHYKTM